MRKGENIFKRKDGRWEARYIKERDFTGKIQYGYCYGKTYKEAKEKVTHCKLALLAGNEPGKIKEKQKFSYFCDGWLHSRRSSLKEATYVKYNTILEKHIKKWLGNCLPSGITSELIDNFRDELLYREGLAPKTVKDILIVLRSVLKYTAKQYHGKFPEIEVAYPKDIKKEVQVLTHNEQQRFVAYLINDIDPCKFGILLALQTGLRIGEICALQWKNISVEDGTIRVAATMQRLKDLHGTGTFKTKIVIDLPKSNGSFRLIPMSDSMAMLCRRMQVADADAYVMTGNTRYMEPRTVQYRFEKYTKECGLSGVHFHVLRHTFATRCVEVGFEIKSLSEILGHASTQITLDRYIHSSIETKRTNMNKLDIVYL